MMVDIEIKYADLQLVIKFPKDPDIIAKVKRLSGRRWDKMNSHWTAPLTLENVVKLREAGFTFSENVRDWAGREIEDIEI